VPIHANAVSTTVYGSRAAAAGIPRFEMGEEEMDPRLAKRSRARVGDESKATHLARLRCGLPFMSSSSWQKRLAKRGSISAVFAGRQNSQSITAYSFVTTYMEHEAVELMNSVYSSTSIKLIDATCTISKISRMRIATFLRTT
jgi:hypothetical protein